MRLPHALRSGVGRAIRGVRLPIAAGPNRGLRWSVASSGRGYLRGRFETERVRTLLALVRPGDCVWDVGAHKGYVALALARRVGEHGTVVAIEPASANQWFLRQHVRWNRLANVIPVPVAVSDRSGRGRFGGRGSTLAFRLGRGDETVRVATLDELVREDGLPRPDVIKIDTEGSELAVLEGGAGHALHAGTVLMVAVHGRSLCAQCREHLRGRGFDTHPSREMRRRLADPTRPWGADHDLLAFGPGRAAEPALLDALPILREPDRPTEPDRGAR